MFSEYDMACYVQTKSYKTGPIFVFATKTWIEMVEDPKAFHGNSPTQNVQVQSNVYDILV